MKNSNTAKRLKTLMEERKLKQVDIVNLCAPICERYSIKLTKSHLSQYVAGKNEPNQEKLFVLGEALNVNEAWLMGFDVPMERINSKNRLRPQANIVSFKNTYDKSNYKNDELMTAIIENAEKMETETKKDFLDYSYFLLEKQNRKPILQAAHERTDIEVTDEMRRHDDELMKGEW